MAQDWSDARLDGVDNVDKGILHLLQQNARENTTSMIGEKVGVSASTVGNRINKLEERGIITSYQPTLDYEKIGFEHHVLLTGTVPLEDLESVTDEVLNVTGVVNVRELFTNEKNVSVELVGENRQRVKEILNELNSLGVHIERTQMMRRERDRPFNDYGKEQIEDEDSGN